MSDGDIQQRIYQRALTRKKASKEDVILQCFDELENLFDYLLLIENATKKIKANDIAKNKLIILKRIKRTKERVHEFHRLILELRLIALGYKEPAEPDLDTFEKLISEPNALSGFIEQPRNE